MVNGSAGGCSVGGDAPVGAPLPLAALAVGAVVLGIRRRFSRCRRQGHAEVRR
jgi:MYXO-CTERM domain-containing protein